MKTIYFSAFSKEQLITIKMQFCEFMLFNYEQYYLPLLSPVARFFLACQVNKQLQGAMDIQWT